MTSFMLKGYLASAIVLCVCTVSAAETELQWTGNAGNGYIDDANNWGGTAAPLYVVGDGCYGNFKGLTGKTIAVGTSADVRLDRLYFQNTQNATFNFDFTGHTVAFQGVKSYPFQTHTTCAGNSYNFLGGTFAFDGQRNAISFNSQSEVTVGSFAVFTGSPEFLFGTSSGSSVLTFASGYNGRAFVSTKDNEMTRIVVEGVDRSTCITNHKASAWEVRGDLEFGSARLGGSGGLWTGYDSCGHIQSVSNALIDVTSPQGHGYLATASNHVLRIFGGTEYVLAVPSGSVKYAFAAGYFGCSNTVEVSGAATRMSLSGADTSLAGISCGVMGDRNYLHITDAARIDIGRTALMIGNSPNMMDRGRSVGNRILVDGGARVSCGQVWVGCAANRSNKYDGTDNTHTYNRSADGTQTKDKDLSIAVSSNVVVFAGHATTGVVENVYVSAEDGYTLPTATDANGIEIRDGATVIVSGSVIVGARGDGNYLTVANGGYLAANSLRFGSDSVLEFGVSDAMSADAAMVETYTAGYNLTFTGAPDVVIDTTGLASGREQTLVAARSGSRIVFDEGALDAMNANLKVKGRGTAKLLLMDNDSRLVAKIGGLSGMTIIIY